MTVEPNRPIGLEPVDRAAVTIVVDNFVDLLMAGADGVRRYLAGDFGSRDQLIAEHGFSALITVEWRGNRSSILYDGGLTPTALARNLDVLQVPVRELRALVVSHGHADHHGGLEALFRRYGRRRLPLVIHPEAWTERKIMFPTGNEVRLPPPSRGDRADHQANSRCFRRRRHGRILPAHCTGWRAVHELARALPDAFVQPAVGTVVSF